MATLIGGILLILTSLFMVTGFLRADVDPSAPATFVAMLIAVVLPAAGGVALLARHFGAGKRLAARRDILRRQTMDAEILRLAAEHGGKLTVVDVVTAMALTPPMAKDALDALMRADMADMEVTDSGVLVYRFHDVEHLPEKSRSKGILDA